LVAPLQKRSFIAKKTVRGEANIWVLWPNALLLGVVLGEAASVKRIMAAAGITKLADCHIFA